MTKKFKQYTKNVNIIIKKVSIKTHNFINFIKRY